MNVCLQTVTMLKLQSHIYTADQGEKKFRLQIMLKAL